MNNVKIPFQKRPNNSSTVRSHINNCSFMSELTPAIIFLFITISILHSFCIIISDHSKTALFPRIIRLLVGMSVHMYLKTLERFLATEMTLRRRAR